MISLAYFLIIGAAISAGFGLYQLLPVAILATAHLAYSVAVFRPPFASRGTSRRDALLAIVLVCLSLISVFNPQLYWGDWSSLGWVGGILWMVPIGGLLVMVALDLRAPRLAARVVAVGLGLALIGLFGSRVLIIAASPEPFIDTFVWGQSAVEHLLSGANPYTSEYWDMYGEVWDVDYGYEPGFHYWPGWLCWATFWATIIPGTQDLRVGLTVADLLTALCLAGIALRLKLGRRTALLASAVWLSLPSSLLIIEQAWADPVSIMALLAAIWAAMERRFVVTGLILGFACATKQYALLGAALTLVYLYKNHGLRATIRAAFPLGVVWLGFVLPFALADWGAFYESTVGHFFDVPPRQDAFTVVVLFGHDLSDQVFARVASAFTWVSLVFLAAIFAWLLRGKTTLSAERWVGLIAVSYGLSFLFGKQAFCNYYYFFSGFVLCGALFEWGDDSFDGPRGAPVSENRSAQPTPERGAPLLPKRGRRLLEIAALLYLAVLFLGLLRFSSRDGLAVTPAIESAPSVVEGTNPTSYRRGTVVVASSYDLFSSHHPIYAIDGEPYPTNLERWVPAATDRNPYLELHFRQPIDFESVRLQFQPSSLLTATWPSDFELRCYSDVTPHSEPLAIAQVGDNREANPIVPLGCSGATVLRADFVPPEGRPFGAWLFEIEVMEVAHE